MRHEPVVAEIMTSEPRVIASTALVGTAAREMALSGIRHLPVIDDRGRLAGVVSQHDLVAADADVQIREVMSDDVKVVTPETAAHEAAYLLLRHQIGCLPVLSDNGVLVGIVTDTDFVRAAYVLLGGTVPLDELEREELEAERV
jgi:CBS domain-containing membrane protein